MTSDSLADHGAPEVSAAIVLLVGLLQGWLPAGSEGFRKFLILFTSVILALVLYSEIRTNRRD
ncbi:hypothetical protein [Kitasatospora sp. NPDC094016]|uniref:hypothetical protein n=1 Tax=Kitasatospora sp. NPDC094016 TaxID=3154986 RepID=UPI003318762B